MTMNLFNDIIFLTTSFNLNIFKLYPNFELRLNFRITELEMICCSTRCSNQEGQTVIHAVHLRHLLTQHLFRHFSAKQACKYVLTLCGKIYNTVEDVIIFYKEYFLTYLIKENTIKIFHNLRNKHLPKLST